ncbi:MAG TPA: hypothetical protein VKT30_16875 [Caulobacteraceae bacterium]|nr:hypothetical protein [Caulobacteraceae bacterium]
MDAQTVIDSYVRDVTNRLPRRDRADVGAELRALLTEELAGRAEAAGRPADEAMATEMLAGFGAPAETAARYRPSPALIDPTDTRPFLTAAIVGGVAFAAVAPLAQPHAPPKDAVSVAVLSWLGLLLLVFAARAWARRHWPRLVAWKPRDPDRVSRFGSVALVAVIVLGIVAYGAPAWVWSEFSHGGRLPAWLAYAPDFQALRLPWLLAVWGAQGLLYAWLAVVGRWRPLIRWTDAVLALGVALVLVWFLAAGPMFTSAAVDHTVKAWMAVISLGVLADAVVKASRLTRPSAPKPRPGSSALAA